MACSVQRITVQHHFLYKRTSPDTLHFTVSFCKSKSGKIFATKRGPDGSCDEAATGGRIAVDLLDLRGHYSKHAIYIPVRRMPGTGRVRETLELSHADSSHVGPTLNVWPQPRP